MRIVKMKSGYRVNMTDSEFAALMLLTQHGASAPQDKNLMDTLPTPASRGVIRNARFAQAGGPLATVDSDRRVALES